MNDNLNRNAPLMISPRKNRMRKWMARRWLYPALYFVVASMVLAGMWLYDQQVGIENPAATEQASVIQHETADNLSEQSANLNDLNQIDQPVEVIASDEKWMWPVIAEPTLEVILPFYSKEETEPAMVTFQDTIRPHVGVDFARKDQQSFDVLAAKSGIVSNVSQDPLVGKFVVIDHADGLQTVYQSIDDVQVSKGNQVAQGQIIARSSTNELEKKQGNHLHFEVRENGQPIDPSKYIKE